MHHLFIINPAAGRKNTAHVVEYIDAYFNKDYDQYTVVLTKYPGHATQIVKENLKEKDYSIYAVGGDGTVNEVLNGIMQADMSRLHGLGIIPVGSGNDFVKSLDTGYTKAKIKDLKDLINRTIEGKSKEADILMADERYFLNVASAGFDAEVTYNSLKLKRLRWISPRLSYFLSVLYTIVRIGHYDNEIRIDDGEIIREKILFIAAGSGRYYGGGMKVLPKASIYDGFMDICMVEPLKRRRLIRLFPSFIQGTHARCPEVTMFRAKKLTISTLQNQKMQIDGEIVDHQRHIEIKVSPIKINLLIPENLRE